MMKVLSVIISTLVVVACSPKDKELPDGVERVMVEVNEVSQDASSFLDKIEIVPLETNDSSLLVRCGKFLYDSNMDMYVLYSGEQIVYTFSGDGKYIANSKKRRGQGPEDYTMVLDVNLNPYLKGIDMLNPYGTVYTYSPTFELLAKRKIKSEFPVNHFMALDADNYVFTYPFLWTDPEVSFVNLNTQEAVNTNYEGTISGNSMERTCFYHIGEHFYFVPIGLNYYFYQIDTKEKKLVPIIYLDFGDAEVKTDGLVGRAWGKRMDSDKEVEDITREAQERDQYLRKSNHILPLLKFFNDDYVYLYLAQTEKGYGGHFIYNRKKKEGFLLKEGKPFLMYPCFSIVNNVLLAMCEPDMLPMAVDLSLMSPEEIQKMEQLKEDDNPVIIKYYCKH